jgi:photosystem II stability/assembly factor-like uncharacterized protein
MTLPGSFQLLQGLTGLVSARWRKGSRVILHLLLSVLIFPFSYGGIEEPEPVAHAEPGRFPAVETLNIFEPEGESNVRSSIFLGEKTGLIGTEETGDIFKTSDGGLSWRKVCDGEDRWSIMDVRNFIRAQNGHIYITTSEPALVIRSTDEGESWDLVAAAKASRTVGLVQLESGTILAGLRRALNDRISIIRSEDCFDSVEWVPLSMSEPRQNVTCFGYWGGEAVLAGIGFERSGKVYKSTDDGKTWRKTGEFPEARDLMGFFRSGDEIYVAASGVSTLYRSTDDGETWDKARQFWAKGFLGPCIVFEAGDRRYYLMVATDQREKPYRHLVLISENPAGEWFEWVELMRDLSGAANNLSMLGEDTIVVGTGNHSAQGRAFTLKLTSPVSGN